MATNTNNTTLNVNVKGLNIATFNVNGLRNTFKRNAILRSLKKLKFDIIALQETHLLENDIDVMQRQWSGPIIYSEGTNMSKGLCFLFRESFHADDIRVLTSSDRFLLCTVKVGVEYFVFGNIYAPNNDKEKNLF